MSPTSDDRTPPSRGARLRAKARVGAPRIRPEVAAALGDLERSLVDVATWERLQPSPVTGAEVEVEEPLVADDEGDDDEVPEAQIQIPLVPDIPPPPGAPGAGLGLPPELIVDLEPAVHPTTSAPVMGAERTGDDDRLLSRFVDEAALEGLRITGPVLPAAAIPSGYSTAEAEAEAEEAERRRRNGRVLSWAGVVLLVAMAALWLIPDRSGDPSDELPAVEEQTSTTDDDLLLDPSELTTTTVATTTTTAAPVTVPPTTKTTTKKSTTTTTTKPATTTTAATLPPLVNPGPVDPSRPPPSETTTTVVTVPG